uniref:Uncharacterized protein n=1 Tax=Chromera velia CCMP2878 TaxID=1169474 RepID=A0A0G4I7A7_9ALVE|eukprot:Cvel_11644.t1-p1 / transcript=Cvel_11644.t1 / gene=Cvel_11644 / organism=Chromera_velia_CCMP2878 / gene_product=Eukaryotic translation initiation factor 4E, putative / transcript_product=Eukaryotic translation initiation factor 4E, putative / location=Cvel_scaffold737:58643-63836(+) / protein_length=1121 / sequence_SO=supercontig / SO=protein_coding / is_pseudo=false
MSDEERPRASSVSSTKPQQNLFSPALAKALTAISGGQHQVAYTESSADGSVGNPEIETRTQFSSPDHAERAHSTTRETAESPHGSSSTEVRYVCGECGEEIDDDDEGEERQGGRSDHSPVASPTHTEALPTCKALSSLQESESVEQTVGFGSDVPVWARTLSPATGAMPSPHTTVTRSCLLAPYRAPLITFGLEMERRAQTPLLGASASRTCTVQSRRRGGRPPLPRPLSLSPKEQEQGTQGGRGKERPGVPFFFVPDPREPLAASVSKEKHAASPHKTASDDHTRKEQTVADTSGLPLSPTLAGSPLATHLKVTGSPFIEIGVLPGTAKARPARPSITSTPDLGTAALGSGPASQCQSPSTGAAALPPVMRVRRWASFSSSDSEGEDGEKGADVEEETWTTVKQKQKGGKKQHTSAKAATAKSGNGKTTAVKGKASKPTQVVFQPKGGRGHSSSHGRTVYASPGTSFQPQPSPRLEMTSREGGRRKSAEGREVEREFSPLGGSPALLASSKDLDETALEREWALWFDPGTGTRGAYVAKDGEDYASHLTEMGTVGSLEEFWRFWNNIDFSALPRRSNVSVFKKGVKPLWEDPANAHGGRWIVTNFEPRDSMRFFTRVVLGLIGETFENSDDLMGVVLSVRPRGNAISVWSASVDPRWFEKVDLRLRMMLRVGAMQAARDRGFSGEKTDIEAEYNTDIDVEYRDHGGSLSKHEVRRAYTEHRHETDSSQHQQYQMGVGPREVSGSSVTSSCSSFPFQWPGGPGSGIGSRETSGMSIGIGSREVSGMSIGIGSREVSGMSIGVGNGYREVSGVSTGIGNREVSGISVASSGGSLNPSGAATPPYLKHLKADTAGATARLAEADALSGGGSASFDLSCQFSFGDPVGGASLGLGLEGEIGGGMEGDERTAAAGGPPTGGNAQTAPVDVSALDPESSEAQMAVMLAEMEEKQIGYWPGYGFYDSHGFPLLYDATTGAFCYLPEIPHAPAGAGAEGGVNGDGSSDRGSTVKDHAEESGEESSDAESGSCTDSESAVTVTEGSVLIGIETSSVGSSAFSQQTSSSHLAGAYYDCTGQFMGYGGVYAGHAGYFWPCVYPGGGHGMSEEETEGVHTQTGGATEGIAGS